MIEAVERIQNRIEEIQNTFKKLGFSPVNVDAPSKPFGEYLNEASKVDASKVMELDGSILDGAYGVKNEMESNMINSIVDSSNADLPFGRNLSFGILSDNNSVNFSKAIESYQNMTDKFPKIYDSIISEASKKYAVPESLIKAVIKQESNYVSNAVSPKGAVGLMQLMPETATELGIDVNKLKEPYTNIMTGTKYLSQMLDKYDGRLDLSLSAYNAGPSLVDRVGRIPNIEETQNYVKNIVNYLK